MTPTILALITLAQLSPAPASRTIQQIPHGWQIDYAFRHAAPMNSPAAHFIPVGPSDLSIRLTGNVSVSRLLAHATPRPAAHQLDGGLHVSRAVLRESPEAYARCAEKLIILAWPESPAAVGSLGRPVPPVGPPLPAVEWAAPPSETGPAASGPCVVEAGGHLNIRLILTHDHDGGEGIEPLCGRRALSLAIAGPAGLSYRDTLDLSRERFIPMPDAGWRPMQYVTPDHQDTAFHFSPPHSLYMDAFEPGMQYFRFPERKVRGGQRIRLRFRYFLARGNEGRLVARVAQYREGANQWKVLDGGFERAFTGPVGKWAEFAMVFRSHDEATTMALDFRLADAEVGAVWVDDVEMDYVGVDGGGLVDGREVP